MDELWVTILKLLQNVQSINNETRIKAELELSSIITASTDQCTYSLLQIALNNADVDITLRQAALLQLKRVVPKYWSGGFKAFVGTHSISQNIKKIVRESLLQLLSDTNSKIRASAGYAIVQIAAVDYPDEWPTILQDLYNGTINTDGNQFQIIGSLNVLQEIFDDVILEDQFFEGGIAVTVLKNCESLLNLENVSPQIKVESLRLLAVVCKMLACSNIDSDYRHQLINNAIPHIYFFLSTFIEQLTRNEEFIKSIQCWDIIYEASGVLDTILNSYAHIFSELNDPLTSTILHILKTEEPFYRHLIASQATNSIMESTFQDLKEFTLIQREIREPMHVVVCTISKQIELLQTLLGIFSPRYPTFIEDNWLLLISINYLPNERVQNYISNFNEFVTDETELGIQKTVRESTAEFFRQIDPTYTPTLLSILVSKLEIAHHDPHDYIESMLYAFQCLLDTDEQPEKPNFDLLNFLELLVGCVTTRVGNLFNESPILISRLILILPKLIMTYKDELSNYGIPTLQTIVQQYDSLFVDETYNVIRASILISAQYFNHFIRAKEFGVNVQEKLVLIFQKLAEDAEEDTEIMLLETMSIIICIDNIRISQHPEILSSILHIGFNDSSNFSLNTYTFECITDIITNIPINTYINLVTFVLPQLVNFIKLFKGEYQSDIDLSLQVINTIIKNPTDNFVLPPEIFNEIFPLVTEFILSCNDDQLLQNASELINSLAELAPVLINNYPNGSHSLIQIIAYLLSPEMSDRAISKLGGLINLLPNFPQVSQYHEEILKALTIRISQTKEIPTLENLMQIFNHLTVTHPRETLEFLKSFQINDRIAIEIILPIWIQTYPVMRGDEILFNSKAFMEIFKLQDNVVHSVLVDGEPKAPEGVIVTRSMAKKLQHEQVHADAKIIQLLINELKHELDQLNKDNERVENSVVQLVENGNEESDGWEDFDDYDLDNLKDYVDASASEGENLKDCIIQFFKQCTIEDIGNFKGIYNELSDSDKELIGGLLTSV